MLHACAEGSFTVKIHVSILGTIWVCKWEDAAVSRIVEQNQLNWQQLLKGAFCAANGSAILQHHLCNDYKSIKFQGTLLSAVLTCDLCCKLLNPFWNKPLLQEKLECPQWWGEGCWHCDWSLNTFTDKMSSRCLSRFEHMHLFPSASDFNWTTWTLSVFRCSGHIWSMKWSAKPLACVIHKSKSFCQCAIELAERGQQKMKCLA